MGNLFKKLMSLIKDIIKWLGPLAIIVYILIWIFAPALIPVIHAWLSTAWAAVQAFATAAWTTATTWLASIWTVIGDFTGAAWSAVDGWFAEASFGEVLKLATGAAIILNPEGIADGVGSIIDSVGDVVSKVVDPLLPWLIGGLAVWLVWKLNSDDDDDESHVITVRAQEN